MFALKPISAVARLLPRIGVNRPFAPAEIERLRTSLLTRDRWPPRTENTEPTSIAMTPLPPLLYGGGQSLWRAVTGSGDEAGIKGAFTDGFC